MDEVDVAIVGGGAAGIGAARRLAAARRRGVLLEATTRLGGRARTEWLHGLPLDLGCGWLHSAERNDWRAIADARGVEVLRGPAAWGEQYLNLGFPPAEAEAARNAFAAFGARLEQNPPASDRASDALDPNSRWSAYLDALSGYINGVALDCLSVADYLAYDEAASEHNWRLPGGYGALVAASMPDLPVRLACPVRSVALDGGGVRLTTARGELRARVAIVTVSSNVLANGAITLPHEADANVHAAGQLPLGLADKLFLALDRPDDLAPETHLLGNPHRAETGSYYLRPFGRPVIECFFGGAGAVALEGAGLDGKAAFAIDELAALLGSDFRRRVKVIAGSSWGAEDWVRGSYSHALPGCAGARAMLARPVGDRIFFAGEACSAHDFSTAHGALATGAAAADAALAALG